MRALVGLSAIGSKVVSTVELHAGLRAARRRPRVLSVAAILAVGGAMVPGAGPAAGTAGGSDIFSELPRDLTLYTTGTATSPPVSFDPLSARSYTGTMGLLYEPLFLYDPSAGRLLPWLASSGRWTGRGVYELNVRKDAYWVNSASGDRVGKVSAADVAYSLDLARDNISDPYHQDVLGATSVTAAGHTVVVHFSSPVNYPLWDEYLWHAPVLPRAFPPAVAGTTPARTVSSGPMLLYRVGGNGACYRLDPWWWGLSQMHLHFAFRYLCDEVSAPAGQQLSALLSGRLDWSNSLLGGASSLGGYPGTGYGVTMYYPGQPFMLPGATEWLSFGRGSASVGDPRFRRALAYAVDPAKVAADDYGGTVEPAGALGLLPLQKSFVGNGVLARYGFAFSAAKAKSLLRRSGYGGQSLQLEVVSGSPEIDNAAITVVTELRAVGVKVSVLTVAPARLRSDLASGNYDLSFVAGPGPDPTPWQYFDDAFSRAEGLSSTVKSQVQHLLRAAAGTPFDKQSELLDYYKQIEEVFLLQLPVVPLWYSGAWFEASTAHWEGYPSASQHADHYTPVMWPGWLGSTTTVLALAALRPVAHRH